MLDSVERPAGEKEMKIVMASLDDAGRTTNLYRMMLDTAATAIPAAGFSVESVEHRSLELIVGTLEDKKADDVTPYSGSDDKLGKLWRTRWRLWKRESRSQRAERHGMTIACTLKEQDDMIVSSVSSALLQGTVTTRNSLTTIAAVSTGRTRCQRS